MQLLFQDTARLRERYGLRNADDLHWRESFTQFRQRLTRTQQVARVTTKVGWAVAKKDKFKALVDELKEFMDCLENITDSLEQLSRRRNILERDIQAAPDEGSVRALREVTAETGILVSDSASSRFLLLDGGDTTAAGPSCSALGQAASTRGTFFSARTHQSETQSSHGGGQYASSAGAPEARANPIQLPHIGGQPRIDRDSFSAEEIEAQTNKFWAFKRGHTDVELPGAVLHGSSLSAHAQKRITKQLQSMWNDKLVEVTLKTIAGSMSDLLAICLGPRETSFQGGIFFARVFIPEDYPFKPPTIQFLTKVYHPNIDPRGFICLDILSYQWSPAQNIDKVLLSIVSLLDTPNPDDPIRAEVAQKYVTERNDYESSARWYTKKHATGEMPVLEPYDEQSPWWKDARDWNSALSNAARARFAQEPPPGEAPSTSTGT